jgi:carbonic anhydrase/acetyltransferase-like protein (isoleucine patch superfamily)
VHGFHSFFGFRRTLRFAVLAAATVFPSFLRVLTLKALGATIGQGTRIYPSAILIAEEIEIGNDTLILPFSVILNLKRLHLGHRCFIHWGALVMGHGQGTLHVGDFSFIGLRAVVNCTDDVRIGAYSCLGPQTVVYTHGNYLSTYQGYPNKFGPVTIGDSTWLNVGVIVLPGVSIGSHTIVKAGCVIAKDVADERVVQIDNRVALTESSIHDLRRERTEVFVDQWYDSLFDDLVRHVGNDPAVRVEKSGRREWGLELWGTRLDVKAVSGPVDGAPLANPRATLWLLDGVDPSTKQAWRGRDWIDFATNEFNFVHGSTPLATLMGYFELRRGVHLTRFRG